MNGMLESDITPFVLWSAVTAIIMGVTAIAYKSYIEKKRSTVLI